jgi:TonB family protein
MTDHKHDIEKYLKGELTAAEMHALEKKALTDPFLADALEGVEIISQDELSSDLIDIRKKVNERVEKREKHISPWAWTMRIAAGLMVLAISTYFILTLTDEKQKSDLALNDLKEEEAPKIQNQPPVPGDSPVTTEAEPKQEREAVIESRKTIKPKTSTGNFSEPEMVEADEDLAVAKEEAEIIDSKIIATDANTGYGYATDSTIVQPTQPFDKSSPTIASSPERAKQKEPGLINAPVEKRVAENIIIRGTNAATKTIKGKVTDAEDGTALPGVNVTVKNTTIGTVTDAEGNFEIPSADPNSELVFSFIGLHNVEVPVNNEDNIDVKMSADFSELSEIVVVGYAATDKDVVKEDTPNIFSYAEPKGGRKAYKNYLAQNLHYPQQAIENKVEGKVTVQFVVETTGLLNEFKVIKGIGYGCDEEVIRLVKNGPKWSPSKRNDIPYRGRVKVRMRFTLPD